MRKLIFLLPLFISFACSEEEVQPISDHIFGNWELTHYFRNGVDETASINIASFQESYFEDGSFTRFYKNSSEDISEQGEFDINQVDQVLSISNISSIDDFSDENSTLSTSIVNIIKINATELIYSFANGGDEHEFRFVKVQ